jgi:hypothetical protein
LHSVLAQLAQIEKVEDVTKFKISVSELAGYCRLLVDLFSSPLSKPCIHSRRDIHNCPPLPKLVLRTPGEKLERNVTPVLADLQ